VPSQSPETKPPPLPATRCRRWWQATEEPAPDCHLRNLRRPRSVAHPARSNRDSTAARHAELRGTDVQGRAGTLARMPRHQRCRRCDRRDSGTPGLIPSGTSAQCGLAEMFLARGFTFTLDMVRTPILQSTPRAQVSHRDGPTVCLRLGCLDGDLAHQLQRGDCTPGSMPTIRGRLPCRRCRDRSGCTW
jgi:hypothetical protein